MVMRKGKTSRKSIQGNPSVGTATQLTFRHKDIMSKQQEEMANVLQNNLSLCLNANSSE